MTDDRGIELLVLELAEAVSYGRGAEFLAELGEDVLTVATQQILDFREVTIWLGELATEARDEAIAARREMAIVMSENIALGKLLAEAEGGNDGEADSDRGREATARDSGEGVTSGQGLSSGQGNSAESNGGSRGLDR